MEASAESEVPCGEVEGDLGAKGSGCFRGRPRGFFKLAGSRRLAIGGEGDRFSTSCVTGAMEFDVEKWVIRWEMATKEKVSLRNGQSLM